MMKILDIYKNPLYTLYQWDVNQFVNVVGINPEMPVSVQFWRAGQSEAFVVESTVSGNVVTAAIPNELLREPGELVIYIWQDTGAEVQKGGRTETFFNVPIKERAQPSDYIYDDNVEYISVKTVIEDAKKATTAAQEAAEAAEAAKTNLDNAKLSAENALSNLNTAISQASTSKGNLDNTIASANETKSQLQTVIDNAGTAKSDLSTVIDNAGTAKSDLSTVIAQASDMNTTLSATIQTASDLDTSLKEQNSQALANISALSDENFNADEILTGVEDIKAYLGYVDEDIAGICIDYQNRAFSRLAGAYGKNAGEDFDAFPMFGGRKRCNVSDDGTIVAYYGDADYAEDGSMGQVMVYQPKFYYKVVPLVFDKNTDSNIGYHLRKANYYVSSRPKTGFKLHPAFYDVNGNEVDYILLSAYEGSMYDASEAAYVNDSVDESIAYAEGDLLCSVAGKKPISGLRSGMGTKANFENMALNRGSGWHLETIKATSANQLLMIVELGTMNTQTGIANGVVSISDNSAYNCSSLTGSTADLGNGTGSATETINEIGGAETTYNTAGKVSVSYRGVENPWGNIWKHIQGVNIWGDGTMCGGQPYIANNFTFNESKHDDNYEPVGFTLSNASGYINAMGYGNEEFDWLLMPSEIGGTSALPVGDYLYVTPNLNGYRIALLGGAWNSGGYAGGFYWYCATSVGYRSRTVGGRLVYVPTATV